MVEPSELRSAREHLARAEATYRTADGLSHLEEGLALLEGVIAGDVPGHREVAQNLASAYSTRIYGYVRQLVETDRGLPEPDLEHLFKLVLAFDEGACNLPAHARSTKINLVRRLIDRYYEGHPPAEKRQALQELADVWRSNEDSKTF